VDVILEEVDVILKELGVILKGLSSSIVLEAEKLVLEMKGFLCTTFCFFFPLFALELVLKFSTI